MAGWRSRRSRTAQTVSSALPRASETLSTNQGRASLAVADKLAAKAQKITIKLPWEITTIFSDVLPTDDEEDEDDIEAHEASIQRLKEADDATREMTREEYQHYSDCRQASFTYRKGTHPLSALRARSPDRACPQRSVSASS